MCGTAESALAVEVLPFRQGRDGEGICFMGACAGNAGVTPTATGSSKAEVADFEPPSTCTPRVLIWLERGKAASRAPGPRGVMDTDPGCDIAVGTTSNGVAGAEGAAESVGPHCDKSGLSDTHSSDRGGSFTDIFGDVG